MTDNNNNNDLDNCAMWCIYGVMPSTAETQRFYVTARTAESALCAFWIVNARDFSTGRYEWIVQIYVTPDDTNPS